MDMFSNQQLSHSVDKPESSSLSDTSVTTQLASFSDETSRPPSKQASFSDDEIILASSRPKKRAGRRVFKETRHPVFRGVRRRNNNKWVCELREPNKKSRIWLGTYPTAEMAARAHDVAALAFRGKLACLNYADSAWRLPIPASTDSMDIRRAAAEAAEGFRPAEFGGVSESGDEKENKEMAVEKSGDVEGNSEMYYLDEEAVFDMPGLLTSMAEGLLLDPPHCLDGHMNWDHLDADDDIKLWSFSS